MGWKVSYSNNWVNMVFRWTMLLLGISFKILLVIRPYPGAFLLLRSSCIMFWISFGVKNLIGCVICRDCFSTSLLSISKVLFDSSFVLNVFSKYHATIFASLSLHAQVWFVFVIGGIYYVGCFTRLVTLQSEQSVSSVVVKLWRYVKCFFFDFYFAF